MTPTCAWCGRAYPVASLARECEARHEEDQSASATQAR